MATLFLILGLIFVLIGSIGILVAAFRESVLWGLFCLFTQIGSLIFSIVHFNECKFSLAFLLFGYIFFFLGITTTPCIQ